MIDDPKPTIATEATSRLLPPADGPGQPMPTGEMLDDDELDALCDETLHTIDPRNTD